MPKSLPSRVGYVRWGILSLLFFATTINYMDRQILGILAPQMQEDLGWNEMEYGHMVTAFQAAYAIGLVVFGRIIDLVGTKTGYSISITLWSVAAMGHALAQSVVGFCVARFSLGLGEAGNFPAAIKAVAEWFPKKERALATGLFNSGTNVGAILAPLLVPVLSIYLGWQMAFIILGAVGFVWLIFWHLGYESPEKKRDLSATELAHIQADPVDPPSEKIAWASLFGYRQTWAYIVGMAFSAPVWWFYLYWLPKFMHAQYGLNLANLGLPLVIIYSMACGGAVFGGWLASYLMERGWTLNAARKTAMLICALLVVPVLFATQASDQWIAALLIGLAASAHHGFTANLYTMVSDLFPKKAIASVVGLGAMFGSVMAIIFAQSTGFILQTTGSYWPLFLVCSFAYLIAIAIMQLLVPRMEPARFP